MVRAPPRGFISSTRGDIASVSEEENGAQKGFAQNLTCCPWQDWDLSPAPQDAKCVDSL